MPEDPNHLISMIESLLETDSRPEMSNLMEVVGGETPIEQALAGLGLAVNAIIQADHAAHLSDWEQRHNQLLEWHTFLQEHPIPDENESGPAIARGEMTVTEALLGTDRWGEIFDDMAELTRWRSQRHMESARKHRALADSEKRAIDIYRRSDERVQQIRKSKNRKIKRLGGGDPDRRDQIIQDGNREVDAISEVAVNRTHALIRQVLDLDENTAVISTAEWLARHGLSDAKF